MNQPTIKRPPLITGDNEEYCDHDWRIDPRVTLTSNPPQRLLVCSKCRKQKYSGLYPRFKPISDNPLDWEKWND